MQQRCVDDAVDGGGGSDAEGHGGDGNQRKSGRPVQHSKRVAEIDEKILSKGKEARDEEVFHEVVLLAPAQAFTTRSISTQAPNGRAATPIVVRAGNGRLKCLA